MARCVTISLLLALGLTAVGAPAQAQWRIEHGQPMVNAAPEPNLGGGLIEMLMTGRDPGPRRGGYAASPQHGAVVTPQGYQSLAALPQSAAERAILREVPAEFHRQEVEYFGPHRAGTIIVDTPQRFLFLVQPGGRAVRYGIGVGRPGFEWAGAKSVTRKAMWPDWTPPAQMLRRRPDLPRYMPGGPENPMGARALYLGSTLYRIHGTNEPHTIGEAVSSGCIRMTNEDVTDLYDRVRVGARVIVI